MRYGYYPGCSLTHSAAPYDLSTRAVAAALGMQLEEVDDWNCCGATEYITLHQAAAYALIGRNLALAGQDGQSELVAPCSACYLNLRKVDHNMALHPRLAQRTNEALAAGGLHYEPGSLHIRHLLDVIVDDVPEADIASRVTHPLHGLRVAPYYGCLIVRPKLNGGRQDPEFPTHMDHLLAGLGADVIDYPLKTHCCGGHMTQISADTAYELIHRLLKSAQDHDADVIVAACPMCQLNLDAYQSQVNRHFRTDFHLPVLYFTQLMGLAFGMRPAALGLGREIVTAAPALAKIGAVPEGIPDPEAAAPRRKRAETGLPMPRRRGES
ncbi:MAG TPA: CoB--CoM heterodisulfide reductase iron-sulfur subunit B family protein [Anaerolineales bacterium]|nr:CoB--CoM heterodisulfide reductase iron-sulfur subunit B family protein [Anaerolineales bacterium]